VAAQRKVVIKTIKSSVVRDKAASRTKPCTKVAAHRTAPAACGDATTAARRPAYDRAGGGGDGAASLRDASIVRDSAASQKSATRSVADSGMPLLRVASACSGMCTESFALTKIGVPHSLVVACEIKPHMRKFIEHYHSPTTLLADVASDEFATSDGADILIAGFPCQPFSAAGLQQGIADQQGRGLIITHLMSWLRTHLPACFVLENVKGLLSEVHIRTFINIMTAMRGIIDPDTGTTAYRIVWKVMNSSDFKTPQEPSKQTQSKQSSSGISLGLSQLPIPIVSILCEG
jgi:hypothetical protein